MPNAAVIYEQGDTNVFRWKAIELGAPDIGEVRVRHTAVGVNYADTYHRRGINHPIPLPPLPLILGLEAVGIVTDIGDGVSKFKSGDRVAYSLPPIGSYCEERNYPVKTLVHVPDGIDDVAAAGVIMTGLTARMLLFDTFAVKPGDVVLVHAAAGGMGHVLCPWAKALGAIVIGTVGSPEKEKIATDLGCDYVINYRDADFATQVRDLTNGRGCDVVYESIGKTTLRQSLSCLRPVGMCAAYGHASGAPDPVDIIEELGKPGALFITRPALHWYLAEPDTLDVYAADMFAALKAGKFASTVKHTYPLRDVGEAHAAIEARQTTGSTVLIP